MDGCGAVWCSTAVVPVYPLHTSTQPSTHRNQGPLLSLPAHRPSVPANRQLEPPSRPALSHQQYTPYASRIPQRTRLSHAADIPHPPLVYSEPIPQTLACDGRLARVQGMRECRTTVPDRAAIYIILYVDGLRGIARIETLLQTRQRRLCFPTAVRRNATYR